MVHAASKGKIREVRKSLDNDPQRNGHFEDWGGGATKKLKSRKYTIMLHKIGLSSWRKLSENQFLRVMSAQRNLSA